MKNIRKQGVILRSDLDYIPNIYELEKLGAGHDGEVYKYKNLVLKLLKYDMKTRQKKDLMTFDKVLYFQEELSLCRITKPIDILLDENGNYTGYVMNYLEDLLRKQKVRIGDYSTASLIESILDLRKDFEYLSKKSIIAKDINRGSFLITEDFLHLCDMDKYQMHVSCATDLNKRILNFVIAKLLYFEMIDFIDKQDRRIFIKWIKACCNDSQFIDNLLKELDSNSYSSINEVALSKIKTIKKIS